MEEKGSNHQLLKRNNYHLIKKYIYQHSPISRVEVAKQLSLTTPTITGMVNPMIARGLLHETHTDPEEGKSAGRPRVMLEFVPDAYYICGVDVGPYRIHYILTDLQGNVVDCRHTGETLEEYHRTLEILTREIPDFLAERNIPKEKLLGVGICLPGLIDGSAGKIYTTFREGWTEHDLSRELGDRLGLPVVVENNVRARAICANLFDRSVTAEPFAYFFASYGVACQMIIDGKVLYGQSAAAGEIGHTVVQRGGPVCPTCGNRGCLESLAGERAVLQRCRDVMRSSVPTILWELCQNPEELTMDHVLKAQEMGDRETNLVMEDVLDYLGIALANIISTVSPRTIMLDAHMLDSRLNQAILLRSVERNMFRVHVNKIQFTFLPYDPDTGARGAAAVVVRELLLNSDM
ncbi:MAG: ROK family transcriptional regulator [Oscillospiraceae bacterium]|nr:ROK family transcriptional regulator [Oscillospiraceae bacterium]